jgi:hypothetical protein
MRDAAMSWCWKPPRPVYLPKVIIEVSQSK